MKEKVSVPMAIRELPKCMDMECELPERFKVAMAPDSEDRNDEPVVEDDAESDLANVLASVEFENEDM